jgi:hypothetical protein
VPVYVKTKWLPRPRKRRNSLHEFLFFLLFSSDSRRHDIPAPTVSQHRPPIPLHHPPSRTPPVSLCNAAAPHHLPHDNAAHLLAYRPFRYATPPAFSHTARFATQCCPPSRTPPVSLCAQLAMQHRHITTPPPAFSQHRRPPPANAARLIPPPTSQQLPLPISQYRHLPHTASRQCHPPISQHRRLPHTTAAHLMIPPPAL